MPASRPLISLIAAISRNGVIGKNNTLPWRLPADLQHFRKITSGHCIISGRKNYEDIGRPLPNRTNIVITRQSGYSAPGCIVVNSLEDALTQCHQEQEVFIIGGAILYAHALPLADKLYITHVDVEIEGDTHFPEIDWSDWEILSSSTRAADDNNPFNCTFAIYQRKSRR